MEYTNLQQITLWLYYNHQAYSREKALAYEAKHRTMELEEEAFLAANRIEFIEDKPYKHNYILVFGEHSKVEEIKVLYPLLSKYLDDYFENEIDV